MLVIVCSQTKIIFTLHTLKNKYLFKHSFFNKYFQNKHFVYILNDMRIITKFAILRRFQNISKDKHFVYILNDTRIITKWPYIIIFKYLFKYFISTNIFKTNTLYTFSTIRESFQSFSNIGVFKIFSKLHKHKAFSKWSSN